MKIAYLAEFDVFSNDGVGQKINQQLSAWNNEGMDAKGFFISHSLGDRKNLPNNINVYFSNFMKVDSGFLRKQLNRVLSIKKLNKALNSFSPDIIYYRQNAYFPGLDKVLMVAPVIMEVNTNDLEEIKLLNKFKSFIYKSGRNKILKHIDAIVAVSYEIENLYKYLKIPTCVIANGYDFSQFKTKKLIKNMNKQINIIFVGSPKLPWHGIEHFYEMAELFPQYTFHLVGEKIKKKLKNLIQYGWLKKDELFKLYEDMDIGVSTLALYRKGMNEASPLKSREYAYYGLPMIVGYIDTDIDGEDCILNIGNYEMAVIDHENEISIFIDKWSKNNLNIEILKKKLDYKYKEIDRIIFMKKIIKK